jgi:sialic acid synthase SpsE
MTNKVSVGKKAIGAGEPVYIIAEIGINHNGDIEIAKQLMDVAVETGCDAVKFQKRTPEICVPEEQKSIPRETPWGSMTYFEYKKRIEFEQKEFEQIDAYAKKIGIDWFASPWDVPSVDFLEGFNVPCQKIASACLTDSELLTAINKTKTTTILSTGMSSMQEIDKAVSLLNDVPLAIAQATSTYPAEASELNLRAIQTFAEKYKVPVGYSGHERGLQVTIAAVALGATFIERHITLDRSMWGTDHSASLEPEGLKKLVRDIRIIELALGDGKKKVYDSEIPIRAKLRRVLS